MNRKDNLEQRILENYKILSEYEERISWTDRPEDIHRSKIMIEKFREIIGYYIKLYWRLCERMSFKVKQDIYQIAADVTPELIDLQTNIKIQKPETLHTNLSGAHTVQIVVSQMFRIVDLLTSPETVQAKDFYEAITDVSKLRRALNRPKNFELKGLGVLKPVISTSEKFHVFWRPALPNFKLANKQHLCFIPFELTLTDKLQLLKWDPESVLESNLLENIPGIHYFFQNTQISARLRIYPPGTGVIRLAITIKFNNDVNVEVISQIARNIEEILFVDPEDFEKPCESVLLEVVDEVIENLFMEEGITYEERRWRPPTTTFNIYDDGEFKPEDEIDELSYLMALAPGNLEDTWYLKNRILAALDSPHWQRDQTLTVAGQQVALFFVAQTFAKGKTQKRKKILTWLAETHELICAATYAQQAFIEEIDNIKNQRLLDDFALLEDEEADKKFRYIRCLLETMYRAMQAISSIKPHLQRHGMGALMIFARDIWAYNNMMDKCAFNQGLMYISEWLNDNFSLDEYLSVQQLQQLIRNIKQMKPPFRDEINGKLRSLPADVEEELEVQLLNQLWEIEKVAKSGSTEEVSNIDQWLKNSHRIRNQLDL